MSFKINIDGIVAGTGTVSKGTVSFSNSNGISFGLNGSTITASYTVPTQSQQPMYFSASGTSTSGNTIQFGNSNGVSFSLSNGSVVGSVATTYLASNASSNYRHTSADTQLQFTSASSNFLGTGATQSFRFTSADTQLLFTSVSSNLMATTERGNYFYTSNNTFANSTHSHGNPTLALTNITGTTASASNGFTISLSAAAAGGGGADGYNILAAGTQTAGTATTVVFANSNGISFGMSNNSQITASYTVPNVPAQTIQTQNSVQVLGSSGNISFANGNNVTFGANGSTITASASYPTQTVQPMYFSVSNSNTSSGTIVFGNSNGVSFSLSNGSIVATVATSYLASNASSNYVQTANSSVFQLTANSSNSLGTGATQSFRHTSADTQLRFTSVDTQLMFTSISSNLMATGERNNYFYTSNNTFAQNTHSHGNPTLALTNLTGTTASASNGFTISLSANVGGGAGDGGNIIAAVGSTANSTGTIVFSSSNGISFGLNGNTMTASHNGLTTAMASNAGSNFVGLNSAVTNITATINSSGISISNPGWITTAMQSQMTSNYMSTAERGNYQYTSNSTNNTSVYLSIGNSTAYQTSVLSNTFALASHSHGNPTLALTNLTGTTASASNGFTISLSAGAGGGNTNLSVYAVGNTTGQSSSSTIAQSLMSFSGAGIASVGYSAGNVIISVPSGGGAAGSGTFGMSNLGNTSGTTGTIAGSNVQVVFAGGNNITLSQSINGSSATITFIGGGAGGGYTLSAYEPYGMDNTGTASISANTGTSGSCSFFPFSVDTPVAFDFIKMIASMNFTTGGTSAFSQSRTMSYGIYSRSQTTGNTLALVGASSFSMAVSYNNSSISLSYPVSSNSAGLTYGSTSSAGLSVSSAFTGLKLFACPFHTTMSAGMYWLGLFNRASTVGFNSGILYSHYGNNVTLTGLAPIGQYSANYTTGTNMALREAKWLPAFGVFTSAGQTNLPSSAAFSAMTGNQSVLPYLRFVIDDGN
jgi:hypothetical protein